MFVTRHNLSGPAARLPATLRDAWTGLRAENPALASPYFHPGFAEAVARNAPDPVTIWIAGRDMAALLPVQGGRSARPVGAPMSDYHGPLGDVDTTELLNAANISVLPVGGWSGDISALESAPVCRIDLASGLQSWRNSRDSSYARHAKSHRRRVRKATAEIGEPHFVWRSRDVDVFNQLIRWKRAQFASTGKYDVLSGWPRALLRELWERGEVLRADQHALYFGDRLAAIDLGLTDGLTFHSWMVAYDPELATYGPGIQLLEGLIAAAPDLGYQTLDLGVGLDGYKRHYSNVEAQVGVGVLRTSGARASVSRLYGGLETQAEPLARLRRRYTQIAACEPRLSGRAKALTHGLLATLSSPNPAN